MILSVPVFIRLPICLWIARVSAPGSAVKEDRAAAAIGDTLKQALADLDYRKLLIGFGTCGFHMCIIQTHMYRCTPTGTRGFHY